MSKLYLGVDFHKNTSTLCVVDDQGKKLELSTIATSKLVSFLSNRKFEVIGIEASGGTNHAVQKLKDSGHNVRIINSNKFKAVGIGGKKTDERDAEALAQVLRTNYAPEVFHKSERARNLKSMLVSREQLVRARVNLVNHIRGTLREYGITMPAGMDKFLEHVQASLQLLGNTYIRDILSGMLTQIETLRTQEATAEAALDEMTRGDERVAKLRTVPGIGNLGSIAIAAVIDDVSRFKDAKHFASYIGLVPREHSSGSKRMLGSITRSGSEIVRRYLIHGARSLLLHTKEDCKYYNRIWAVRLKDKAGMNKEIVAMAHKLARIAFSVLKSNREYTIERPKRVA